MCTELGTQFTRLNFVPGTLIEIARLAFRQIKRDKELSENFLFIDPH